MKSERARSLRWSLTRRLVTLQAVTASVLIIAVTCTLWALGFLIDEPDSSTMDTLQSAIARDAQGRLTLREGPEIAELFAREPRLWFVIQDQAGDRISHGAVPADLTHLGSVFDSVEWARLGWELGSNRPALRLDSIDTAAGKVRVLASSKGGRLPLHKFVSTLLTLLASVILPYVALSTLLTFMAASIVVRKSLASLSEVAAQAKKIDFDRQGNRLPAEKVPMEVIPLVGAVNDALQRLDEGYERHKRFLLDAAHELRTPIAILQTRAESLQEGSDRTRLLEDIARLVTLAEQLLDLQRLNERPDGSARADLVAIGRRVSADLAPLAIAAGYEINFESPVECVEVHCDGSALERAVTNLVQNAIEYGGRHGAITVRVAERGTIEVIDEGPGVPPEHRERIFEPFYRAQPRNRGAGLGLHLVREIVQRHGGLVTVHDRLAGGACFTIALPPGGVTASCAMLA